MVILCSTTAMTSFLLLTAFGLAILQAVAVRHHGLSDSLLPYPRSLHPAGSLGSLYVFPITNLANPVDVVTVETLAGVLARTSPTIYVTATALSASSDTTVFWLRQLQARHSGSVSFDETTFADGDLQKLIRHFQSNITGYVTFDPSTNSTNTALIYCAAASGNVIAVGKLETVSAPVS